MIKKCIKVYKTKLIPEIMIKEWIKRYKTRNCFDPSGNEFVGTDDLVKILRGHVTNRGHSKNSVYFVVCCNGLEMLQGDGPIRVDSFPDVVDNVFHKSEWFGKFSEEGKLQIIVPSKYDLLINTQKKQIWLESTERARYYGSGNLQLDKDLSTRILRTDIGFMELGEILNSCCSEYIYGNCLRVWNY